MSIMPLAVLATRDGVYRSRNPRRRCCNDYRSARFAEASQILCPELLDLNKIRPTCQEPGGTLVRSLFYSLLINHFRGYWDGKNEHL